MEYKRIAKVFGPFMANTVTGAVLVDGGFAGALAPLGPLAPKTTTTAGWDDTGEFAIPTGAVLLHVSLDEDAYLVPDSSTDDPAQLGAVYQGGMTHLIPCRGATKLHSKRATDNNATIGVNAFGNGS